MIDPKRGSAFHVVYLSALISFLWGQQGGSIRLLAGNTGPGIYKDWPAEDAIIDVKHVKELQTICCSKKVRRFQPRGLECCSEFVLLLQVLSNDSRPCAQLKTASCLRTLFLVFQSSSQYRECAIMQEFERRCGR